MGGERLAEGLLVRRVRVGVKQADRHALHRLALEAFDDPGHFTEIERRQYRAIVADALAHLGAEPPRYERLGLGRQIDPVEMGTVHAADLEHVAESASGDQADRADLALDDRVGDERRSVGERGAAPGHAADRGEPVEQAARRIGGRRRDLERARSARRVTRDEIGEGPADVDADANAVARAQPCLRSSSRPI